MNNDLSNDEEYPCPLFECIEYWMKFDLYPVLSALSDCECTPSEWSLYWRGITEKKEPTVVCSNGVWTRVERGREKGLRTAPSFPSQPFDFCLLQLSSHSFPLHALLYPLVHCLTDPASVPSPLSPLSLPLAFSPPALSSASTIHSIPSSPYQPSLRPLSPFLFIRANSLLFHVNIFDMFLAPFLYYVH